MPNLLFISKYDVYKSQLFRLSKKKLFKIIKINEQ